MRINFITNIPADEISGGISGMSNAAFDALSGIAEVNYIGPVNPPRDRFADLSSKALKVCRLPRPFVFFSRQRLETIASQVGERCWKDADLDFYMGFTPWVLCKSSRPYVAWNDCTFEDYIRIYHDPKGFARSSISRILGMEAEWMANALRIYLSSEWAAKRSLSQYELNAQRVDSVGIFGGMTAPEKDLWDGSKDFYFISTDYRRKNGGLCRQAMNKVWERFPEARLRIIGDRPPESDLVPDRVTYEGFFNKSNERELEVFRGHLAKAFALVHPTDADITALITTEASYFGCPVITVRDFALPEVLSPSNHHLLLDRPLNPDAIAEAMIALLASPEDYKQARTHARAYAISHLTRDAFTRRLQAAIGELKILKR